MKTERRLRSSPYAGWLLLALIIFALPLFVQSAFYYDVLTRICLISIAVLGLDLLLGYAGQVSLGQAAFYAAGAYGSAILSSRYGITPILGIALTAVAVGVGAWLVGRPILHLKGLYLSLATLGLGIIVAIVIGNEMEFTGGPDGMSVPPLVFFGHELSVFGEYSVFGMTLAGEVIWYLLAGICLLVAVLVAINLMDSPMGRATRALRDSEIAAEMTGVDTARFKMSVFIISAVYASIAGSLYGHYSGFITPGIASFEFSIELIIMVVLGGMASTFGAIVGTSIMLILPQFLTSLQELEMVLFGLILMVVMIFLPRGLLPTLRDRLLRKRRAS